MRPMRPIHLVPAAVVLLALGGIAAAAQLAGPAASAASAAPAGSGPGHAVMAPRQVAVTSAARACPPVQGGGSQARPSSRRCRWRARSCGP